MQAPFGLCAFCPRVLSCCIPCPSCPCLASFWPLLRGSNLPPTLGVPASGFIMLPLFQNGLFRRIIWPRFRLAPGLHSLLGVRGVNSVLDLSFCVSYFVTTILRYPTPEMEDLLRNQHRSSWRISTMCH